LTATGQKGAVEKYLKELAAFTPLPPTEELDLARKARKGDLLALHKLVKANLRFVISIAKDYQGCGLALEDLISEGNLGLMKAAQRFDETRGFKFISYAVWWIRQCILQALAEQSRAVRLPMNRVGAIQNLERVVEKLQKRYGREPVLREVADHLQVSDCEVADVLNISARHLSLDKPLRPRDGSRLLDVLENGGASPDDFLAEESLKEDIKETLSTLTPREAEIIQLYFGLVGERPLTLDEIGEYFDLTRERIRQIKEKALRRMRRRSRLETLKKYLGSSHTMRLPQD
jgi:RNA polymerase primary sigma factor